METRTRFIFLILCVCWIQAHAADSIEGVVLRELWRSIGDATIPGFTNNGRFPNSPDSHELMPGVEPERNVQDYYGQRLRGFLRAPQTGSYTFWIASDDQSELWLSTDETPNNRQLISMVQAWTDFREWNKYPQQQSSPITLIAGQKYFFEAIHVDGISADGLSIGWQLPDGNSERPITANRLSSFPSSVIATILEPLTGGAFLVGDTIRIAAATQPSYPDRIITKVDFYVDDVLQGSLSDGTSSFSWVNASKGLHTLKVKAWDSSGTFHVSDPVKIGVVARDGVSKGLIVRDYWLGITGSAVSDLTQNPRYHNSPDGSDNRSLFEAPVDSHDDFGSRMRGFIYPPESGDYVFWLSSDNQGELWLSSTESPGDKTLIARVPDWTNSREWNKFPEQRSTPIRLVVGRRYYIEALAKDFYGGDNLAVGWQLAGGQLERPIPGSRLSPFLANSLIGLKGKVTDQTGAPLLGALVEVSQDSTTIAQLATDSSGNFTLPAIAGGVYVVSAGKQAFLSDRRVVSLSAQNSFQDFLLRPMPVLPSMQIANSTPPFILPSPENIKGSTLKVFSGASFVEITAANKPTPDKMTIVLTHGWLPCNEGTDDPSTVGVNDWPLKMAKALRDRPETSEARVNIVAWDWFTAAKACLPPEGETPKQGIALGQEIYRQLGGGYLGNVHFMGHSLGTLVNAYAADYLQGHQRAKHKLPPTPWTNPKRWLQMTLFDDAAISRLIAKEVLETLAAQLLIGGAGSALGGYGAAVVSGYKNPIPHESAWIDNYPTSVGVARDAAVNACLQKGLLIELETHSYRDSAVNAHGYGMGWYQRTLANPGGSVLGFGKSYEYASFHTLAFPPSGDGFAPGAAYHQNDSAADELVLDQESSLLECHWPAVGIFADAGVDSALHGLGVARDWTVGTARGVWGVSLEWGQRTAVRVGNGVQIIENQLPSVGASVLDLMNRPEMRLILRTGLVPFPLPAKALGEPNSDSYVWLQASVPAEAALMMFNFTVTGNGNEDTFVFGINNTNLFSIETQFVLDGELTTSPVIDVSSYAGRTNEFFFGILGGTSTNCSVTVEGISFLSLSEPRLLISQLNGVATLSWPSSAAGYVVESTPNLASPNWLLMTNSPRLFAGQISITNPWPNETRFFRLRR